VHADTNDQDDSMTPLRYQILNMPPIGHMPGPVTMLGEPAAKVVG
jgi:hypothetical protein